MSKKPFLLLQPMHSSSTDIMRSFAMGKPLSGEQLNLLYLHQKQLSDAKFDPVLQYYLKYYFNANKKRKNKHQSTFLFPHEELNENNIQLLKKRILLFLKDKAYRIVVKLTQKQFLQFKEYTTQELIFWHGNQFLTGAPFYPSSIPPVIFFQWGNLFGIVKYLVLAEEKALKANILIYFEDIQDRALNQCVKDYDTHLQDEMAMQNEIFYESKIEPVEFDKFLIKTPVFAH